jgi:hypothetical protein
MARSGPPPRDSLPRYGPERPLPARPYRLGRGWPHPRASAPAPCSAGTPWRLPADLPPPGRQVFRHGVDLFNAGCWWEAHEEWEALWAGAARGAPLHALLQGLILLAAAHLQHECGRVRGAARLAGRARERLAHCRERLPQPAPLGLPLAALIRALERWPDPPAPHAPAPPGGPPAPAAIRLDAAE